jgi:PTS system ascorbate-specific IIA component
LVAVGAVEDRYVDAAVAAVETQGPYMVLAPGVALAHARPEDGAVALGLSVAVLAEPVSFGHPTNDPVDVVLAFGSPDRDQHVGLLAALARQLRAGLLDDLRTAAGDEDACRLLDEVMHDVHEPRNAG